MAEKILLTLLLTTENYSRRSLVGCVLKIAKKKKKKHTIYSGVAVAVTNIIQKIKQRKNKIENLEISLYIYIYIYLLKHHRLIETSSTNKRLLEASNYFLNIYKLVGLSMSSFDGLTVSDFKKEDFNNLL